MHFTLGKSINYRYQVYGALVMAILMMAVWRNPVATALCLTAASGFGIADALARNGRED